MPRVAFLIPAYNAAATLDAALASVASQTFTDWEAIVVDDGSTDATPALLSAWQGHDPRFRVLRNEPNQGIVASLNRAIAATGAPFLARMDADDLSVPTRIEKQLALMEALDLAAAGSQIRYFPEEQVAGGAARYAAWLNSVLTPGDHEREIFVECPLAHPSMLLRADAVRRIGGYQAHGWAEDYDLLLRLWMAGGRIAKVPEVLLHWREGAGRTSRTHPDYAMDAFIRCKCHYLRRSVLAGDRPALIFGAGPVGKSFGRALLAHGVSLHGYVDIDPRKIGQRIHARPVLAREAALALKGQVFGLAAMGRPDARAELRRLLLDAGWDEGRDFRCVS